MAQHWRRKTICETVDDPQIHSDKPIRTKRSLDEAFGAANMNPYEFHESGIPWLAKSVALVLFLLALVIIAFFLVMP